MSQTPFLCLTGRYPRELARVVLLLGIVAGLSARSEAQTVVHTFVGDMGGDKLGLGVSGCGDIDGDGIPDVAVGAIQDGVPASGPGYVRIHSGSDGSLIRQIFGNVTGDVFGTSIDNAGDCNGDGIPDLIVGAPFAHVDGQWKGYAQLHSGADGSVLHTFVGDNNDDFFGIRVCGIGDVNADGHGDIAAGAVQWLSNGTGYVKILSGFDGSLIHHISGNSPGDQFGYAVDGTGDVDGDMVGDIVVGAWWGTGTLLAQGMVGVYSGATGNPIHIFWGDDAQDHLGSRVAGAGDVDGDGVPDIVAGASGDDGNGASAGAAMVFSGATGALIYEFLGENPGDQLGNAVTGAGDVDGDGRADIGVAAIRASFQGSQSGRAYVFSGMDGSTLLSFDGAASGDSLGGTLSGVGDVNGDGKDDLIVGATGSDLGGANSGVAYVLALTPWTDLGLGLAGGLGVPALEGSGPLTTGSSLTLELSQGIPSGVVTLVVGVNALLAPFKGGTLVPSVNLLLPVATDAAGDFELVAMWPGGVPSGATFILQAWFSDPLGPQGFAASNGLQAAVP
jgi:hypothetical protein